jgi:hypothetical protein
MPTSVGMDNCRACQQGADAEPDKIGSSRKLEDGEGDSRAVEQLSDTERGGGGPGQDADADAKGRERGGATAASQGVARDQRHIGAGVTMSRAATPTKAAKRGSNASITTPQHRA